MNYTNEIHQIITAIKDGATAITPAAQEFVRQYVLRETWFSCIFGIGVIVTAVSLAIIVTYSIKCDHDCEDEAVLGIVAVLTVIALFVLFTFMVFSIGNAIAPIPSLLGK